MVVVVLLLLELLLLLLELLDEVVLDAPDVVAPAVVAVVPAVDVYRMTLGGSVVSMPILPSVASKAFAPSPLS